MTDDGTRALARHQAAPLERVCPIELVALSERFNQLVFLGAAGFVALSTVTAAAFLPLRDSAVNGRPPLSAIAACLAVLVLAGVVLWRAGDAYRALRRYPQLELMLVLIAALLLSVATPLRNELWWPAAAILMLLATLVTARRALAYCFVVLGANLMAHVVSGSIEDVSTVAIAGLWVGLPFWTAMAAIIPDRLASSILRLNTMRAPSPASPPPRRVRARTRDVPTRPSTAAAADFVQPPSVATTPEPETEPEPPALPPAGTGDPTSRLTARQLQVVALLAEGMRYREVAACLAITDGQVHRHVANALARAGVASVYELVTLAVAAGVFYETVAPGAVGQA